MKQKGLEQRLQNIFLIHNFIENLKINIRKKPKDKDEFYIALFVLEVTYLENQLRFLTSLHCCKSPICFEEFLKITFGRSTKLAKKIIISFDGNKIKDFRIRFLFEKQYLESFFEACQQLNNLRNELYHNLFNTNESIKEILNKIKQRIEIKKINYEIKPNFYKNQFWKTTNYRSVVDKQKIPQNWTIEMLIEIVRIYRKILETK